MVIKTIIKNILTLTTHYDNIILENQKKYGKIL